MQDHHWQSQGVFWLDKDDSNEVPGTISYSSDVGCELHLIGTFEQSFKDLLGPSRRYPLVHGTTNKFKRVVVFDAVVSKRSLNLSAGVDETVLSSPMVHTTQSGHDVASGHILKLRASLTNLETWLAISGFELSYTPDFSEVAARFRLPGPVTFRLGDGIDVAFTFGFEGPTMQRPQTEVRVKQSTQLDIVSHEPRSLQRLREVLRQTSDFISLGIGVPTEISHLSAQFAVPSTESNFPWADIWLKRGTERGEARDQADMIFTFQDVISRLETMLVTWSHNLELVNPTYQLYFGTIRSTNMYAEHRLFNFFQALESFHQWGIPVDEEAKSNVLVRRDRIIRLVPEGDREWLSQKLAFCHQPTASERIRSLIKAFGAQWIFGDDWEPTIQRIVNVRNCLTHFTRKPPEEDLRPLSLWNFGSALQVLCETVLLCQAGLAPAEAQALLQKNRRLQSLTYSEE